MWELDHKESWVLKNWCFWAVVLEKTLESPLDSKEIQPVRPKGNQSWIFIGRVDAEVEAPILWSPDAKTYSLEKTLMLGKIEGRRRRGRQRMRWSWVWASSGSWWWTGKSGVLQSMGLQRVRLDWATELNWSGKLSVIKASLLGSFLWGSHSRLGRGLTLAWGHHYILYVPVLHQLPHCSVIISFLLCLLWNIPWEQGPDLAGFL